MGQCTVCREILHTNFLIPMDDDGRVLKCVFCELDKKEITIVNDKTGKENIVAKKDIVSEYKQYINRLYHSKKIQELVRPDKFPSIIKP